MLYCAAVVSLISLTHELSVSEVWVMTGAVVSVYLCCLQLQNIHNGWCSSRKKACKSFIIFRRLARSISEFVFLFLKKFFLFEKVYSSSLFDLFCACKCISLNNQSLNKASDVFAALLNYLTSEQPSPGVVHTLLLHSKWLTFTSFAALTVNFPQVHIEFLIRLVHWQRKGLTTAFT